MGLGYRRSDLRAIAQAKLDDAKLLLSQGRYSNAYYLAGYAVEIGLKACIARHIVKDTFPDKQLTNGFFSHELQTLVGLAGLAGELKQAKEGNSDFAVSWALAVQWREVSRYETQDQTSAETMVAAVDDPKSGVLRWIKQYW